MQSIPAKFTTQLLKQDEGGPVTNRFESKYVHPSDISGREDGIQSFNEFHAVFTSEQSTKLSMIPPPVDTTLMSLKSQVGSVEPTTTEAKILGKIDLIINPNQPLSVNGGKLYNPRLVGIDILD